MTEVTGETPKPNCVGYALNKLGIIKTERFVQPDVGYKALRNHCEEVESDEAQAIVATFDNPISGKRSINHIAMINPENRAQLSHRQTEGAEVSSITRAKFREDNPIGGPFNTEIEYVKLKD